MRGEGGKPGDNMRTGGEILVDQLAIHGVRQAFCVPGESYLAALDAFYDRDIKLVICRQEGGAAMMAEAVGKTTNFPGICFVTRGPGATNASPGIHIARQDSTPMIVFVGQIGRDMREREAFQELDYRAVFSPSLAKWSTEIDDVSRIPEIVSRAFYTATSGRPGPVVIALPEDMLTERAAVADAPAFKPIESHPGMPEMQQLEKLLHAAKKPIAVIGGSRWSQTASDQLAAFAERLSLPVCTTFRRAHLFDSSHPCYAGDLGIGPNPKLLARVKAADLVLLIGDRMSEMSSQSYTLFDIPAVQTKLVHVHPGAEELGRVYAPHLAIQASPTAFCAALDKLAAPNSIAWNGEAEIAHDDYLAWTDKPTEVPGGVNLGAIMVWLREHLGPEGTITNGAGNFATWIHRFYRFRKFGTHVGPTSGSMGYGVPAAVVMKFMNPERDVVCIAGDGDFLMNGQEFATAVQYKLPIVIVVADNGMYGTIRMHQEKHYPGRIVATELKNPDFAAYAKAFGGFGIKVERTEDFASAFEAAQHSGLPSMIHLKVDPQAITPTATIDGIRKQSQAHAQGQRS